MKNKQQSIIYILAIGTILVVFFFIIPTNILNKYDIPIAIIAPLLIIICLYKLLEGKVNLLFHIIIFFVLGFIFLFYSTSKLNNELEQNSISTKALVLDGNSYRTRKNKIFNIKLRYKAFNGEVITVQESVNENLFQLTRKGDSININYSSQDFNNVSIVTVEDIRVEQNKSKKELTLRDIINIQELSFNNKLKFLNDSIKNDWTTPVKGLIADGRGNLFELKKNDSIIFSTTRNITDFTNDLDKLKFTFVKDSTTFKIYNSKNHKILILKKIGINSIILKKNEIE